MISSNYSINTYVLTHTLMDPRMPCSKYRYMEKLSRKNEFWVVKSIFNSCGSNLRVYSGALRVLVKVIRYNTLPVSLTFPYDINPFYLFFFAASNDVEFQKIISFFSVVYYLL